MAFIRVVTNGKVTAERVSTFGNDELSKDVSDMFKGKNIKVVVQNSRQRRKNSA